MYTISNSVNKDIQQAKRALNRALEALTATIAYNNNNDLYHACTVSEVNRIITAIELLND